MPVVRSAIPYRKSRRLRQTDPKYYEDEDGIWETYDESFLAPSDACPVTVKSEADDDLYTPPQLALPVLPDLGESAHIPRPRNAFICFRSDYVKAEKRVSARPGSLDQTVMSRGAGDVWRGMGEAERLPYIRMAQAEKKAHTLKYPNYRYAPGSANGVARKSRKPKQAAAPLRASTAKSEASDGTLPSPISERTTRKYETNPPASRRASRKKSTSAAPRSRRTFSTSTPYLPSAEILEPIATEPLPERAPSPAVQDVDSKKEDKVEPQIVRSSIRPSSYDRSPTQFGFKESISPTVIESLSFVSFTPSPSPSIDMQALSLEASPSRSPSPAFSAPKAWDSWRYAPLELCDDTLELQFDAAPADFGFFHPWNMDTGSSALPTFSDDLSFTS